MPDTSELWDVIVIGSGPAGSSAARTAAESGARVMLLDKAEFPRSKTCGGGLTGVSMRNVPASVLETVEQQPRTARFSQEGKFSKVLAAHQPLLGMVQRERFDQALVDVAIQEGVVFRSATPVSGLDQTPDSVSVATNRGAFQARIAIGADGCGGRVGRYVGVETARTDLGLEYEIAMPQDGQAWANTIFLDSGRAPGTYAWVFPKMQQLSVGVIQRRGYPAETRQYSSEWLRHLGLSQTPPLRSSGHLTQWRTSRSPLRRGRVLVAGDAAGLLDPWTREGISFALRSGKLAGLFAAEAVKGSNLRLLEHLPRYEEAVHKQLVPEINAGRKLLQVFEEHGALLTSLFPAPT